MPCGNEYVGVSQLSQLNPRWKSHIATAPLMGGIGILVFSAQATPKGFVLCEAKVLSLFSFQGKFFGNLRSALFD